MKFDSLMAFGKVVFTLDELSLLARVSKQRLSVDVARWVKTGRIVSLKAGVYALTATYHQGRIPPAIAISAKLSSPSYITDLAAMMYYGMIPEMVFTTVAVHLKREAYYDTCMGRFKFHRISPRLFFGFKQEEGIGWCGLVARPEKAVLDYLYLRRRKWEPDYIASELRPTISDFDFDTGLLQQWSELYPAWVRKGSEAFLEAAA